MSPRLGPNLLQMVVVIALTVASSFAVAVTPTGTGTNFEGQACDDHDPCTVEDHFAKGMCRGEARRCDDGRACTDDFCDRASGRCRAGLLIDHCLIDGQCRSDGEVNPENSCLVCRATLASTKWTETTHCDDGDPCTVEDRCLEDRCVGRTYTCPSAGSCRFMRCDGKGGCVEEAMPDRCTIDGTCYALGAPHPADPCLRCDPDLSGKGWAPAEGAKCPGGVCQAGRCVASLLIEKLGEGAGRVIGPGFTCRTDCLQTLAPGERVDLVVVTEPGSVFRGWSGVCVGIAPCTFDANGEMRAIAIFDRGDAVGAGGMATLKVVREGGGTVSEAGGRIHCGSRCSSDLIDGTAVDLTADADSGERFAGWAGACVGTDRVCSVLVSGFTEVVARFEPVQ